MKFLPLLLAGFRRHKLRTLLTVLSIVVAFVLFGYLAAIRKAFDMGVSVAGQDRLVVRHKVSLIQLLPASYEADLEKIEGVKQATHSTWFGGIYQEPKNFFAQIAVDPAEHLEMYPEFLLPEDQKKAFINTRTAAIVGRVTAERFGFKVGQKIPLQATIWRPKSG
ncbi:MAG TPA: ABC transporter permease, partial [Thermoanaerobaculia bacterium]